MNQSSLLICGCFLLILFLFLLSFYSKKPSTVALLSTCWSISCEGSIEQVRWASSIYTKALMCSSYVCSPYNPLILYGKLGFFYSYLGLLQKNLRNLLVRSVKMCWKAILTADGGVQPKQKHCMDFSSCHQVQVKCGFKEQMSIYFKIGRNWVEYRGLYR